MYSRKYLQSHTTLHVLHSPTPPRPPADDAAEDEGVHPDSAQASALLRPVPEISSSFGVSILPADESITSRWMVAKLGLSSLHGSKSPRHSVRGQLSSYFGYRVQISWPEQRRHISLNSGSTIMLFSRPGATPQGCSDEPGVHTADSSRLKKVNDRS